MLFLRSKILNNSSSRKYLEKVILILWIAICSLRPDYQMYIIVQMAFFHCRVVEFASYGDLKNAIEKLSGKEINGRKIKLIEGSKRHRYLTY